MMDLVAKVMELGMFERIVMVSGMVFCVSGLVLTFAMLLNRLK